MMKNIAIILAGGSGQRMGEPMPKQFLKVAGKRVIEHTIDVFEKHPLIDEIAVVCSADYQLEVEKIALANNYSKLKKILIGGKERYHSSLAAINAYKGEEDVNMLFHDSVRPLVTDRIINDVVEALNTYKAVDVATETTDTIIQVNDKYEIVNIPPRAKLRNGQTPQAFKLSTIQKAYELALKDPNFKTTDDCGVVLHYLPEEPLFVVQGEPFNMKLTFKDDLFLIDKLFQLRTVEKAEKASEEDLCRNIKDKVVVVFGGTYGIGADIVTLCKQYQAKVYSYSRTTGVNVSNPEEVSVALADAYQKEGRIDYVVNTAGILMKQSLASMSYEDMRQSIDINYWGAVVVAKESFKYLSQSKGMLLFYTSSSYTLGRSMYCLYSSSKAAIVNLVQALNEEWHQHQIRINCINPERTRTPMRTSNFGNEPEDTLLDPETVALVSINTLLSDLSGEIIDVKIKKKKS